tara:strand:+ start:323 stop:844 length:522 start_codon:yes stop_codon:yes gene_type:complete
MATKVKQAITASQWKKKNLNERNLELPSGAIFKVKNIDIQTMLTRGYLSLELLNSLMVLGDKVTENKGKNEPELKGIAENELKEVDDLARQFSVLAVVAPELSFGSDKDSINVYDLIFEDVLFIFSNCVRGGATEFAPFFRKGSSSDFAPQSSSDIQPKTINNDGDTKSEGSI